ncbi:hypothetical protein [Pseudomonas sp. CC120222-01a]|uniref:hypothetical protein n=1 Tax=Pseudomonas sp. CC120222-01a TaxID=1378075 RepID=UPI000D8E8C36|nr:hypothetical protein [Pseudomonas sp. CC120222-01a]PVZ42586.1 hypothetical protein N430_01199 [Pseudomonas sp. CC120222-01a]
MKPDLPPVSPRKFHPSLIETPVENRLNLPDGRMAEEISTDRQILAEYCQSYYGETWASLRCAALHDLSTRLGAIRERIPVFEELLDKGQPAISLRGVYDEMYQSLLALYAKGSLNALLVIAELQLIGDRFPPLRNSGKEMDALRVAEDEGNIALYAFLGDHLLKEKRVEEAAVVYHRGTEMGCSACHYQLGQLAEWGVGEAPNSAEIAYAHYQQAARMNYPPASVALAKLLLTNTATICQPISLVQNLEYAVELGCEGAAVMLNQILTRLRKTSDTPQSL